MSRRSLTLLLLVAALALAVAQAVRTTIVLESPEIKTSHSKFFKLLAGKYPRYRQMKSISR